MGRVRVKICGITSREDAECAAACGADALGFIFYPSSPRHVTPQEASRIIDALPPFVTPVGVFVNEPADSVRRAVEMAGLRAVQLSGDEPPEACQELPVPVIRTVRVRAGFSVDDLSAYPVGTFHLDTQREGQYGGTGTTFDWNLARDAARVRRVIVAGGLTPGNVADAIRITRPYGVDSGSGVEAEPGRKDHRKLADFVRAARSAEG